MYPNEIVDLYRPQSASNLPYPIRHGNPQSFTPTYAKPRLASQDRHDTVGAATMSGRFELQEPSKGTQLNHTFPLQYGPDTDNMKKSAGATRSEGGAGVAQVRRGDVAPLGAVRKPRHEACQRE